MITQTILRLTNPSSISRGLALIALLLAPGSIAAAHDQEEERHIVTGAKVVVVQGEDHRPTMAWSLHGPRSYLGVQLVELTPELRRHFGVPEETGVLISRVTEESPAAAAGIEVGDILTALDGEGLESPADLVHGIARHESGDTVDLEIWRGGRMQQIPATLAEREGRWVDIRQFHIPEGHIESIELPDIEMHEAIELDSQTLNRAIERLNEEMSSPEWHERIQYFREHQSGLMEKIELLERRLEELEEQLEELPEDK
jgi:hypothetical protein